MLAVMNRLMNSLLFKYYILNTVYFYDWYIILIEIFLIWCRFIYYVFQLWAEKYTQKFQWMSDFCDVFILFHSQLQFKVFRWLVHISIDANAGQVFENFGSNRQRINFERVSTTTSFTLERGGAMTKFCGSNYDWTSCEKQRPNSSVVTTTKLNKSGDNCVNHHYAQAIVLEQYFKWLILEFYSLNTWICCTSKCCASNCWFRESPKWYKNGSRVLVSFIKTVDPNQHLKHCSLSTHFSHILTLFENKTPWDMNSDHFHSTKPVTSRNSLCIKIV